jgi:hypothetical protein
MDRAIMTLRRDQFYQCVALYLLAVTILKVSVRRLEDRTALQKQVALRAGVQYSQSLSDTRRTKISLCLARLSRRCSPEYYSSVHSFMALQKYYPIYALL